MEKIKILAAGVANITFLEVVPDPSTINTVGNLLLQLITTAVTVWYMIKKSKPKTQ